MSPEEQALFQLKGLISDLPAEDSEKIKSIAKQMHDIVKANDTDPDKSHGQLAAALFSLEFAVAASKQA